MMMHLIWGSESALDSREAASLGNTITEFGISLVEVLDGTLQDVTRDSIHTARQVGHRVLSHGVAEDLAEEGAGLSEIAVRMVGPVPGDETSDPIGTVPGLLVEREGVASVGAEGVRLVVGSRSYIDMEVPPLLLTRMGPSRCPLTTLAL
jgi:hypothetical protein